MTNTFVYNGFAEGQGKTMVLYMFCLGPDEKAMVSIVLIMVK